MPAPQFTLTQRASVQAPWLQTSSGPQVWVGQSLGKQVDAAHFWPEAQGLPHEPQFDESTRVSTQAPPQVLEAPRQPHTPPAHVCPPAHCTPTHARSVHWLWKQTELGSQTSPVQLRSKHTPSAQAWPAAHARPQPPQFKSSSFGSTHCPEQLRRSAAHVQAPWLQTWPEGQTTPTQAFSTHVSSKHTELGSHVADPQFLGKQALAAQALSAGQAVAQVPQFASSVLRIAHVAPHETWSGPLHVTGAATGVALVQANSRGSIQSHCARARVICALSPSPCASGERVGVRASLHRYCTSLASTAVAITLMLTNLLLSTSPFATRLVTAGGEYISVFEGSDTATERAFSRSASIEPRIHP